VTRREKLFIQSARIAHLASADDKGRPHVVPICFVFDGKEIYSPLDEKPKKTAPLNLKRVRNILANPHVAVVVDRYAENWQKLAYMLIAGRARLLFRGDRHVKAVLLLRKKYPQYRKMRLEERPIILITCRSWRSWRSV